MEEPLYIENNQKKIKKIISISVFIIGITLIGFYLYNKFDIEFSLPSESKIVYFEDKEAGFSFEYLESWGDVIVEEFEEYHDINLLKLYRFSNNEKVEIKSSSSGFRLMYLENDREGRNHVGTHPYLGDKTLFDFCMDELRQYNHGSPDETYFNVSEGCDSVPIGMEMITGVEYKEEGLDEKRYSTLGKYYKWKLSGKNYTNLAVDLDMSLFVNSRYDSPKNPRFYPEEDRQLIKKEYQKFYVSTKGMEILDFIDSFKIFENEQVEPIDRGFSYKTCGFGEKECNFTVNNKKFYISENLDAESRWNKYELRVTDAGEDVLLWSDVSRGESGIFKKYKDSKYLFWHDGGFGIGGGHSGMRTYIIDTENLSSYKINKISVGYIKIDKAGKNPYSTVIKLGVSEGPNELDVMDWKGYPKENQTQKYFYNTNSILVNDKKVYEFPESLVYEYIWSGGELEFGYDSPVGIRDIEIINNSLTFNVRNIQDNSIEYNFIFNFVKNELIGPEGNVLGEIEDIEKVSKEIQQTILNNEHAIQNCQNIDCLISSIKNCSSAEFSRSTISQVLGSTITTNIDYEIKPTGNQCSLDIKLNQYHIEPSSELLADANNPQTTVQYPNGESLDLNDYYSDLNEKSKLFVGRIGSCRINGLEDDLVSFFSKKEGEFGFGDGWILISGDDLNCGGELFEELKGFYEE